MKNKNKRGFTIVELVVVIAVIAILAAVLIPTFAGMIGKANDSVARQNASNAYKQYMIDNIADGIPEMFLWSDPSGKFVAVKSGSVVGVYDDRSEAVKSLCGDDLTGINETFFYKLSDTTIDNLSVLMLKKDFSNLADGKLFIVKSVQPDTQNKTAVTASLYHETLKVADVSVPNEAIKDTTKPVTVTISSIENYLTTEGEDSAVYAYDIHVDNLKSGLSAENYVTVTLAVPEGVISPRVYHLNNEISDASYDKTAGTMTFKTGSFSPFAVAYTEKHVSTWNDLRAAMKEDGANVVLDADIEADLIKNNRDHASWVKASGQAWILGVMITNKNVALDLNGHTIDVKYTGKFRDEVKDCAMAPFFVEGDCDLTIKDSVGGGGIKTNYEMYTVWSATLDTTVAAPRIDIYGGTFVSYALDREGGRVVAICYAGERGEIYVHGGTFIYRNTTMNGGFNIMNYGYDHTETEGTKFDNPDSTITIEEGVIISSEMYGQDFDVGKNRVRLAKGLTVVKTGETDKTYGLDLYKVVKKAETKFENTDTYLYRVGNANAIKISSLYNLVEGGINAYGDKQFTYGDLTVEKADTNANISWTFTNADNYGDRTIKFTGTGAVKVKVDGGCELLLEVVDGKNVTQYSDMNGSVNNVLLCDVKIASEKGFTLNNATLYGNGFTFDITGGTHAANTQGVVRLLNATIDNVKIIGDVYTTYADQMSKEYYPSAVVAESGICTISNSYISGCRSAVRLSGVTLTVENSTLYGGRLSNLEMTGGNLTLRDVTTINELVTSGGTTVMGFGIFINNDAGEASINIEGNLTQYNWAKKSDKDHLPSSSSMNIGVNFAFGSSCAQFQKTYNGETYVNFGILNISSNIATSAVSGQSSDYAFASQSGAWVCTIKADSTTASNMFANGVPDYDETAYKPTEQGAVAPTFTWSYPGEYNTASGKIVLSFEQGKSATLDPNFLTATKNGVSLSVSVAMDGMDYTGKSITFTTAGDYILTYTLTDPYNYNADASVYNKAYTFTVPVQVIVTEPEQKHAEFKYTDGNGTKTVTINGKIYVMPDVSETSSSIASTTVDGQTVYMPIVEVKQNKSGSNVYFYSPAFSAINITDYDASGNSTIYNSSTRSLPATDKFNVISGNPYHPASNASYRSTEFNSNYDGLCYKSWKDSSKDIGATTQQVCFSFTDNAGTTYYYYVQYAFPSHTACLTPDTLITLADGTQKRVDSLNGTEMLLVWNMVTGKLDSAPIMFIDSDPVKEYEVIHLYFSDGTEVKVISEHGFWDYDLNRYVYLDRNASGYIGHTFAKQNGSELGKVTLDKVEIKTETTSAWSPVTAGHLCYFVDGMLSMPGGVGGLFNIFEVDPETMTYDAEAMQRDIEKYGLFTYEELNAICPLPEEMFEAAGGKYLKVSIGKGNLTMEELVAMIGRYTNKFN